MRGVTERQASAIQLLDRPGDYALVVRGVPRAIVLACPDGCGQPITLNLDPRSGKAWRTYGDISVLSIYPSVWRDDGCKSHFIICGGLILWCGGERHERPEIDETSMENVQRALTGDFHTYEEIASKCLLNPWVALWACEELVRQKTALRGRNFSFRRR
jgi:hypothetical protein